MTSQINYSAINESYPVPGQDNNSQGFRDNFAAISAGLAQAATEITALQTNGIDVTNTNGNNLQGSTLYNGLYKEFNGAFYNVPSVGSGGATIFVYNGPMQQFMFTANATLTFDWSGTVSGTYAVIRVMLSTANGAAHTVSLSNGSGSGPSNPPFKLATGWSGGTASVPTVSLNSNGATEVIEVWTITGGTTAYIKNIGEY
jgi:hypothetical protein